MARKLYLLQAEAGYWDKVAGAVAAVLRATPEDV